MRHRVAAALLGVIGVALAGCGSVEPEEPAPSPSVDVEVADDAGPAEEPGPAASEEHAEPEPEPEPEPLPDGPTAVGQVVTNGRLSVVVPDGFAEVRSYHGGPQFDGPPIPETTGPDGIHPALPSSVWLLPVGSATVRGFFRAGDPNVTQTVYSLTIPGAESAGFEFLSLSEGLETELINTTDTTWTGPQGSALIWVVAGDEVSAVYVITHPGQAGLDFAMSIARTVSVV